MATKRPRKKAKTYHHGDLRQALLQGALAILSEEGLEALSLREVARRIGVSPAAPYHHFPDRAALLRELAAEGFQLLLQAQRVGGDQDEPPRERLASLGRGYVRFALEHPAHFRLMFAPGIADQKGGEDSAEQLTMTLLRDTVAEALKAAGRRGDPTPTVVALWAGVHGLAKLWLEGPLGAELGRAEFEVLVDQVLEVQLSVVARR